jgi:ATP-independent RNA helicase DbpA
LNTHNFSTLGLSENLLSIIDELGFTEMTPIQAAAIPPLLAGKDLIGQSKTGSGKTAAFVIPILQKIDATKSTPQALILCPTRELSDQVLRECQKFSQRMPNLRILGLVGGQPYPPQVEALVNGVHLIVGTPGRTLEHIKGGRVDTSQLKVLVLDEADRLFEEGFADDMKDIIEALPKKRQTLFFSATFPPSMKELSHLYLKNPERVKITEPSKNPSLIEQFAYDAEKPQKIETLIQILQKHPSMCTLIFCRMKITVDEVGKLLAKWKVNSQILHADLKQTERDRTTALFRNGSVRILVATDVAARGLDIDALELVINFDMPPNTETYIHRIGRTGRAGRKGTAVSIVTAYEAEMTAEIQKATNVKMIRKPLGPSHPSSLGPEFQKTLMKTILISTGNSEKIKADDIMAALTGGANPLSIEEIGKIEIQDQLSYVAVIPEVEEQALLQVRSTKFRGANLKASLMS